MVLASIDHLLITIIEPLSTIYLLYLFEFWFGAGQGIKLVMVAGGLEGFITAGLKSISIPRVLSITDHR